MPFEPAQLAFRDDGTPYSPVYDDIYHSSSGGLAQARHVFIAGNQLPARWRLCERHTIVETGFGQGLNFLATWHAWRADPQRCARLHFVSVELHPFHRDDLATLHAQWPELADLAAQLRAHWPALTPGFHRLHLDGGAVVLTLLFGDAREALTQLQCRGDAFYLDGFSPSRNPDMWDPALLAQLGRLAAADATIATWSVNGRVRTALAAAGFHCRKIAGFGPKRQMLAGRYSGGEQTCAAALERHALVIGAGLAGSSIANRLAERGWRVDVIDEAGAAGQGASGNLAGVLRPLPSLDDNRLARLTRAGTLYGLAHLRRLDTLGLAPRWAATGVLHLARDPRHEDKQREIARLHGYGDDYLRFVERDEAARIADWPVAFGGWWFPGAAWVRPPSLCAANLAAWGQHITTHYARHLQSLEHRDGLWHAIDATGALIARAPVAVLANGTGINALPQARALPVRGARGQVTHLPAPAHTPKVVVCRLGYVSPAIDGIVSAGATFSVDDDEPQLRDRDQRENLAKLDFILPGYPARLDPTAPSDGRVGFRPASPDRLPMVGAVPAVDTVDRSTALADIPRHPDLYAVSGFGARGLVWAALAAEVLASTLDGDPLPLERDLVDAIDPARYLLRPARKQRPADD
ncbi:MAG: bifunctional tRNA (5-methylaminomethyl-2-thiouridine)(34)-methyltransferase MnmD/FAD-dependent 5-carboxymethylaminomethyl-2-thiouridine(34) oxidoreductase MnmC [Rhodocyclales bacterium]|nr:bifunctional tRNA (5-methylaminomethyl-2-thiouridine)(34)-methyltransferase MnmD/FAD-dependent 5-carboxymethylaminomethyl-2-thiouridine(34) oxidoreductase MnmC [Rhodocyclales bacterium]